MKTIQQLYGRDIWIHLIQSAVNHSQKIDNNDDIYPTTRLDELFPPKSDHIRVGHVMFDMFKYVNQLCQVELEIDYDEHSEYFNFPKLEDIWVYFINRLEDVLGGPPAPTPSTPTNVVIPFPSKKRS